MLLSVNKDFLGLWFNFIQQWFHGKQYRWYNGIATACFKSVLECVKILTKKYRNPESIDNLSKIFVLVDTKTNF